MNTLIKNISALGELLLSPQLTTAQRLTTLQYLFRTIILRTPIIRSLEIIHTLNCNCSCAFCSNDKLAEQTPRMSKNDVFRAIDKIAEHGSVAIIFLGGESLTDPDFLAYVHYTRQCHLIPLLQTNGTLLTEARILSLKAAGLYSVTITLHDTIAEKHDSIVQCNGAFTTIVTALPLLKKHHIKTFLKTVYSRSSIRNGSFMRIRSFAREHGLLLNINPIMPVGKASSEKSMLSEEEKTTYFRSTLADPSITTHTKTEYDSQCPGGHLYLSILPNGEILPCYFLPVSVGNIRNISISEAQQRAAALNIFNSGVDSCIVAMNVPFYQQVIAKLYSGTFTLPVNVYENDDAMRILKCFADGMRRS